MKKFPTVFWRKDNGTFTKCQISEHGAWNNRVDHVLTVASDFGSHTDRATINIAQVIVAMRNAGYTITEPDNVQTWYQGEYFTAPQEAI